MIKKIERTVACNENGKRIGEDSYKAKLTNREVDKIRYLREVEKMPYHQLAKIFEVSTHLIGRICRYERRNHFAAKFKKITVEVET